MSQLRIFSYLPNPRIWKATIAARLCGVEIDIRGAPSRDLADWLWDFDARPLTDEDRRSATQVRAARTGFSGRLHKTDAFLAAHPFGTVPAAFSPDGSTGIFESNSIMRAVARLGADRFQLYGRKPYEAARIDSFLDVSLVFARDSQSYLLALRAGAMPADLHARTADAFAAYMAGIEQALAPDRRFLVSDDVTLADICFAAEIALFSNEHASRGKLRQAGLTPILHDAIDGAFPRAARHFARLRAHPAFAPDMEPYLRKLDERAAAFTRGEAA